LPDQSKVHARRRDGSLGFLLESMEDVNGLGKAHGVNGAECVAIEIIDNLQHAGTAKSFSGLA
jgi:hypothetical protein